MDVGVSSVFFFFSFLSGFAMACDGCCFFPGSAAEKRLRRPRYGATMATSSIAGTRCSRLPSAGVPGRPAFAFLVKNKVWPFFFRAFKRKKYCFTFSGLLEGKSKQR